VTVVQGYLLIQTRSRIDPRHAHTGVAAATLQAAGQHKVLGNCPLGFQRAWILIVEKDLRLDQRGGGLLDTLPSLRGSDGLRFRSVQVSFAPCKFLISRNVLPYTRPSGSSPNLRTAYSSQHPHIVELVPETSFIVDIRQLLRMTTLTSQPITSSITLDIDSLEPDDTWKTKLKEQIEDGLRSMVMDAKKSLEDKLKEAPVDFEQREKLADEHHQTMRSIRRLAQEQYANALERERVERRWAAGQSVDKKWGEILAKEQQAIMDNIKKEDPKKEEIQSLSSHSKGHILETRADHISNTSPTKTNSPESSYPALVSPRDSKDGHSVPASVGRSSGTADALRSATAPVGHIPLVGERFAERWKPSEPTLEESERPPPRAHQTLDGSRRPSMSSIGRARGDSFGRNGSSASRSSAQSDRRLPERWTHPEHPLFDEPDDINRQSPSRPLADRADQVTRRSSANSPTKSFSKTDIWLPTMSPAEDAAYPRAYTQPRRGSQSSTMSTYRSPASSQVPDRPSTLTDTAAQVHREKAAIDESQKQWTTLDRAREREQGVTRSDSWQSAPTDAHCALSHDVTGSPMYSSSRSPTSLTDTSRYPPLVHHRPLTRQTSYLDEDHTHETPSATPAVSTESAPRSPSASMSIPRQRSAYQDDSTSHARQHGPSARGWDGPSRSPQEHRHESSGISRSPLASDDASRGWAPSSLRSQVSLAELSRARHEGARSPESGYRSGDNTEVSETSDTSDTDLEELDLLKRKREAEFARHEAERMAEEARRKEEEVRRREEAKRLKHEARLREEEARQRKEDEVRQKEEEANRRALEVQRQEEESRKKAEEIKKKEEELKRREEELNRREAETRQRELEAKKKEEARLHEELEAKRKAEENHAEEERQKRAAELKRREEEKQIEIEARKREEAEAQWKKMEATREEQRHQEESRKREADTRHSAEDRPRHESFTSSGRGASTASASASASTSAWSATNRSGPTPQSSPASNRTSTTSSTSQSSTPSAWSTWGRTGPGSQAPGTGRTSTPSASSKPANSTANVKSPAGSHTSAASVNSSARTTNVTEAEWNQRQAQLAQEQQEKFRREQERLAAEKESRSGPVTKADVVRLFAAHENLWNSLDSTPELSWISVPWPVLKRPTAPEEFTNAAISAYVLSPHGDKTKTNKERITHHIRRWHPDRFDTKLLPKVREEDRARVKQGAGEVARVLNDLLTRSQVNDVFS
jgi:hypothetical protein